MNSIGKLLLAMCLAAVSSTAFAQQFSLTNEQRDFLVSQGYSQADIDNVRDMRLLTDANGRTLYAIRWHNGHNYFSSNGGTYATLATPPVQSGVNSLATGPAAIASARDTTAIGAGANAGAEQATAIGALSSSNASQGTATGFMANNRGLQGLAQGAYANTNANWGVAQGYMAEANAEGCVALGAWSVCEVGNTVSVGNTLGANNVQRRITNVGNGINANDAATMGQLQSVTGVLGGGAAFINGAFTNWGVTFMDGATYNTISDALLALDGRVNTLENNPGGGGGPGSPGPSGPAGPTGPQGPAGNDGATGPQGPTGNDGATGPQGPAGNDGATGPQGPAGPQGVAGVDGAQGEKGDKGDKGDQGDPAKVAGGTNITTEYSDDTATVSLSDDVALSEQGSLTVGSTQVRNEGVRVQGGPSVTTQGVDGGNRRVTGVAPGRIERGSTDAVNGGQLWDITQEWDDRWTEVNRGIAQTNKRVDGLGAQTAAISMMTGAGSPHGLAIGEVAMNAGLGLYGNEAAVAIGWSSRVSERVSLTAGLAFGSSNTKPMGGVGVSIRMGR
ncbi:YadA C-terminal domain-containing protein [Pseudoxanthomonas winnipegensis]|uniref:YadA C-terminal domain-containing protein n=1 Tax=Pseudoxanthomonas winnipegensis TaxID=2480810 RepID=UPI00103EB5CF|nr:YadA C-terminal domain-containing protein [Pseudoxanthomonas winnipegensis]TBV69370.1 hypothetical protein EYC45_19600 [Pseudoxanthomonas winnipegensis]